MEASRMPGSINLAADNIQSSTSLAKTAPGEFNEVFWFLDMAISEL